MDFSQRLAEKILNSRDVDHHPDCFHWAKLAIVDTVGVGLAGVNTDTARIVRRIYAQHPGNAHLIGVAQHSDAMNAALINGTTAHALDYDDITQNMMGHPSVAILPAVLALAETHNKSGLDVLRAYLTGFETVCRLGRGMTYKHHDQGWHSTGTLGIFGAVAATAEILELDRDQTATALAMACSLSSGVRANFGTMAKPLHAGLAARNGVFAATMAKEGFTANGEAFEHKQGFFKVYNDGQEIDQDVILRDWFDPPDILDPGVCLKLYPCGAHTHPFIEMVRDLRAKHHFSVEDIERVEALSEQSRHNHTNRPHPRSGLDGKFSVQYTIARTLLNEAPRLEHFTDDAVNELDVRSIMELIEAIPHPELDASWADKYGGEVVIMLKSGERHRARIEHQLARSPNFPLSEDELRGKFLDCAAACLSPTQAATVFEAFLAMDSCENLASLMETTIPQ